jgi:hypothetical protein
VDSWRFSLPFRFPTLHRAIWRKLFVSFPYLFFLLIYFVKTVQNV